MVSLDDALAIFHKTGIEVMLFESKISDVNNKINILKNELSNLVENLEKSLKIKNAAQQYLINNKRDVIK